MEGSERGLILRHYPSIRLSGLRKTMRHFSQNSPSTARYLNPGLPELEAGVVTARQ
jgi:hypothetical protein